MNSPAHWLSLFSMVMHLTMGVAGLFPGPWPYPPSWLALYALIPGTEWAYPAFYILTGLVAGVGVFKPAALRWSLVMSAVLFLLWGLLGFRSMTLGTGGNIQGAFANLYIVGAALVLAYYVSVGTRGNRINQQAAELQEKVDQVEQER